jgi:hypothetical protein
MKKIISISVLVLVILIILSTSNSTAQNIPKIQVIWRSGIIVSVLVASNTTQDQYKSLINEFRKARKTHSLTKFIPATTPGIKDDPHAQVIIFVFSDSKWATENEYKKYERASMRSQAGKTTSKTYLNHIRASYEYNMLDGKEYGSLGYDEGGTRSASYKKLF